MTDATLYDASPAGNDIAQAPVVKKDKSKGFVSKNPDVAMRAVQHNELGLIHARLMEAIDTTADYTPQFRAYEKARLSPRYLANLYAVDPDYIRVLLYKNEIIGFMISGPEYGTLWLYWSYIFPEHRRASLSLSYVPLYLDFWDNGRFHKIATYTLTDNKIAVALMKRFKFDLTCTLKNHLFGQDFLLWEHPLTKTEPGYDNGINIGLKGRIMQRIRSLLPIGG